MEKIEQPEFVNTMEIVKNVRYRDGVLTVTTKDIVTDEGLIVFVTVRMKFWYSLMAVLFPDFRDRYHWDMELSLRERCPEGMEIYVNVII